MNRLIKTINKESALVEFQGDPAFFKRQGRNFTKTSLLTVVHR